MIFHLSWSQKVGTQNKLVTIVTNPNYLFSYHSNIAYTVYFNEGLKWDRAILLLLLVIF